MAQTFELLKPDGHFVFSVPHPLMLYLKEQGEKETFGFEQPDNISGRYFSFKDRQFSGTIKTTDGKSLNVKMFFKTLDDYLQQLKETGFELVAMEEARVLPEHVAANPVFFESVKDCPLHIVFKVKKPAAAAALASTSNLSLMPKKIVWPETLLPTLAQSFHLYPSEAVFAELYSAVDQAYERGVTSATLDMTKDLPTEGLPATRAFADRVRQQLLEGAGVAAIQGVDMERLGGSANLDMLECKCKLLYYILSSHIGKVDAGARGRLFDVKNANLDTTKDNVLFSVSQGDAGWHTDGASVHRSYDVVSLLCISQAERGGEFRISNAVNALEKLKLRLPRFILNELYRPIYRDVLENGSGKGVEGFVNGLARTDTLLSMRVKKNSYPIFAELDDRVRFRYMRYWIETGHKKAGHEVSPLLKIAMDELDRELDHYCVFEQRMKPGEIVYTNNLTIAHARRAFTDSSSPTELPRHLVRAWLQIQHAEAEHSKHVDVEDSRRLPVAEVVSSCVFK
eukprot:TRINITY_DN12617_c2_g5_i1.p1 TRINITY_DN12617_c2_g5~~TRINITY_DN12617_c2_g5_i1.p1  ORF type:complete len:572 (+),score=182.81 TRINITY_DN12617_c2_g5_i1:184-1716(+)